jgi:hypothetical protein
MSFSELEFLKNPFRENGYSLKQIQWVLSTKEKTPKDNKKPNLTAFLPYYQPFEENSHKTQYQRN